MHPQRSSRWTKVGEGIRQYMATWEWHVRRKTACMSIWDHCSDSVENPAEIYASVALAVLHKLAREWLSKENYVHVL